MRQLALHWLLSAPSCGISSGTSRGRRFPRKVLHKEIFTRSVATAAASPSLKESTKKSIRQFWWKMCFCFFPSSSHQQRYCWCYYSYSVRYGYISSAMPFHLLTSHAGAEDFKFKWWTDGILLLRLTRDWNISFTLRLASVRHDSDE